MASRTECLRQPPIQPAERTLRSRGPNRKFNNCRQFATVAIAQHSDKNRTTHLVSIDSKPTMNSISLHRVWPRVVSILDRQVVGKTIAIPVHLSLTGRARGRYRWCGWDAGE